MTDTLTHRGPDASGVWLGGRAEVAFGHRRLSVIDVTEGGSQPMTSASGRYTITFNGEIYNYRTLKRDLCKEGRSFRSQSDTEVLLEAIESWGIERALEVAVGMFAFGLWDQHTRRLSLARDRAGEKPLYVCQQSGWVAFGSELKSIRVVPGFRDELSSEAIATYLRLGYVPGELSIYRNVRKVLPGTVLEFQFREGQGISQSEWQYWSLPLQGPLFSGSYREALDEAERLLKEAVERQLVSDVPLGAFLSGGIDSTAIVALMQEASSRPIRTFSIGSAIPEYNEAHYAQKVAKHLGTDHTEWIATDDDALELIPRLAQIYDEPFADSSQIATVLVSRLARQSVTVSLSGDAGDELFGGYNRYRVLPRIWRKAASFPVGLRQPLAKALEQLPSGLWEGVGRLLQAASGRRVVGMLGEKVRKVAFALSAKDACDLYARVVCLWQESPITWEQQPHDLFHVPLPVQMPWDTDLIRVLMYMDFRTYLPGDILVKVDRATMSVSLEARAPMLDRHLVDFMASVPSSYKIQGRTTKPILREIAYRRVPRALLDRPKQGFAVPIGDWLRGRLRDWAESLLDERRIREEGILDPVAVRRAWADHQSRRISRSDELWTVLMLQAWLNSRGESAS
jgi:asparagine synthase (glutamine-hydrolysing)